MNFTQTHLFKTVGSEQQGRRRDSKNQTAAEAGSCLAHGILLAAKAASAATIIAAQRALGNNDPLNSLSKPKGRFEWNCDARMLDHHPIKIYRTLFSFALTLGN